MMSLAPCNAKLSIYMRRVNLKFIWIGWEKYFLLLDLWGIM